MLWEQSERRHVMRDPPGEHQAQGCADDHDRRDAREYLLLSHLEREPD